MLYLFDFDYTLVDSSRGIVMCFRHVLNAHGLGRDITDTDIKRTIGLTLEEAFATFTGSNDKDYLHTLRLEYVHQADTCMTANTRLFPETAQVLTELHQRGHQLVVISTKYRYRIVDFLRLHHLDHLFTLIIGGEDVTEPKPSPQGVHLALRRLGIDATSASARQGCLYVGDSLVDARTAAAASLPFAAVLHGTTLAPEFAPYPSVALLPTLEGLLTL